MLPKSEEQRLQVSKNITTDLFWQSSPVIPMQMRQEFPDGYRKSTVWIYKEPRDFLWDNGAGVVVNGRIKKCVEDAGLRGYLSSCL